ncbi:hypothetical protein C8T65DRAFT_518211, partial [Cerioporus squamosus]
GTHAGAAEQLVVCKVSRGADQVKRLHTEARLYTTSLLGLQERVVPGFFGLFAGYIEDAPVGVMVLRYCGRPLSDTGETFMAYQIYEAVTRIHQVGYAHMDIAERNVLCDRQGKIWIVDFGQACYH